MKKHIQIAFILLACVGLILSCGGSILVNLYTGDIIDVAENRIPLSTISVDITVEGLEKEEDINFLRGVLNSLSNEHIVDTKYSKGLAFNIKVPIVVNGKAENVDLRKDLFYITVESSEFEYRCFYYYNTDIIEKINKYVMDSHMQSIDINDYAISLLINNDLKDTKNIKVYSAYINGQPYPGIYETELKRHETLKVEISEVLRKAIINGSSNYIFSIKK